MQNADVHQIIIARACVERRNPLAFAREMRRVRAVSGDLGQRSRKLPPAGKERRMRAFMTICQDSVC